MHSFFVPSLALQVYSIAGRINEIWTEVPLGKKKYYGHTKNIQLIFYYSLQCTMLQRFSLPDE